MSLDQLHDLRIWHLRHMGEHPLEKNTWDMVLTFWLVGWVGTPTAVITRALWAVALCLSLLFLPGAYVRLRRRLHRSQVLRCDWIAALR
jgi:hypothetical protein